MFRIGDRVVYTGEMKDSYVPWVGRTGTVYDDRIPFGNGQVAVVWDRDDNLWPEDKRANPFVQNLRLLSD